MMIEVKPVNDPDALAKVHEIRRVVFVVEQNCPPELEYEFEDESRHFLATVNGIPAGASRWRETEKGYKLERFAVLKAFRGQGVGQALLEAVLEDLPDASAKVYLHAQVTAIGFYLKNGFAGEGDHFWEAGIEHLKMVLQRN